MFLVPFVFCHTYTLLCIYKLIVIIYYTTEVIKMEEDEIRLRRSA
nr:MAG TPA: hypothetical protein [Caudoviricetes sp.]